MAKKPAKQRPGTDTKSQPKKTRDCPRCDGEMIWAKVENKKMKFWCQVCGCIEPN